MQVFNGASTLPSSWKLFNILFLLSLFNLFNFMDLSYHRGLTLASLECV